MVKKNVVSLHSQKRNKVGVIAQLVEQRTENPCVPGSIPGDTTRKSLQKVFLEAFLFLYTLAYFRFFVVNLQFDKN